MIIACVLTLQASCSSGPTFHEETLTESLHDLLLKESIDPISIKYIDHTLAVQVEYADTLAQIDDSLGIGPGFDELGRKVLSAIHRILLSTDADIRFYVLLVSDPQYPGAYLTMVRYAEDIRKAYANLFDSKEMFLRTIFDLDIVGTNPLTIDQYVPRDITLEEFLSWQLARRIQNKLTEEMQEKGVATVGRCGGEFENGVFAFTLNVTPANKGKLDEDTLQSIFETSTTVIAKVLSSYNFEDFDAVKLIHYPTGRNLVFPKASLELFR